MSHKFRNGRIDPKRMVCAKCLHGNCADCVDVVRVVYNLDPLCTCQRAGHSGEPRDAQVLDPETGTVYGPGIAVTAEGEVNRL